MTESVLVQHDATTTTLLLNRSNRRNALSHELLSALGEALASHIPKETSEVVITGAGSCFSAGADYRELTGTIKDTAIDESIGMVTDRIRALPIRVTAVVNGPCLGGAVDLALSCDRRVASPDAYFQVPATRLSILYNPVSVQRMVLRYGKDIVHRLLVMGERIDAPEALVTGMVAALTGDTNVDHPAQEIATSHRRVLSRVAIATRDMIDAIDKEDFDLQHWDQVRRSILSSDERFEAVAAFKSRMQSRSG